LLTNYTQSYPHMVLTPNPSNAALVQGVTVVKEAVKTAPSLPGVYRMIDAEGGVLYIGKAKNLPKRLVSYTKLEQLSLRMQRAILQTVRIELVATRSEGEALLLEASLIKSLKPRYNILLRDDKSYPFIAIDAAHDFPKTSKFRGRKRQDGSLYYGPFASASSVNEVITTLQRLFLLRSCEDSYFAARKRPCLQYQIKRCSAPCVGKISQAEYRHSIEQARLFLEGKSSTIQQNLTKQMEAASEAMEYEQAAKCRDKIAALAQIQARQYVYAESVQDADIIAMVQEGGITAVQVFFFRGGQHYGNRTYFPAHTEEVPASEIMDGFMGQLYQTHTPPPEILISHAITEGAIINAALSELAGYKVQVKQPKIGDKFQLVQVVLDNAKEIVKQQLASSAVVASRMREIANTFYLKAPPLRIEAYDNSHIMGEHAVGAMVVAGPNGLRKSEYRKFSLKRETGAAATGGDDYAMMRAMLTRRVARLLKEHPEYTPHIWPDLWLIDGGKQHLNVALEVLRSHNLGTHIACVAIAKGPDRNAGRETFFTEHQAPFGLDKHLPLMRYLQQLRDEVHRYAIMTHRAKRERAIRQSSLDTIPNIGPKLKKQLLHYFGSAAEVMAASFEDLEKVAGIGKITARGIYDYLHARK
jgi:excinuclease ABC subunit C